MREVKRDEDERKDQPQGEVAVVPQIERLPCLRAEEGEDCCLRAGLVERTLSGSGGQRLKRNGAEGLLILGEVLAEHIEECLGLLRAQIDALEAADGDLIGRVLVGGAEGEEEIPDAGAHLHAVGVALAIVGRFRDVDPGLCIGLMNVCHVPMLVCSASREIQKILREG